MVNQSKFEFICSYLHHSGRDCRVLTEDQHNFLFSLGDGYGRKRIEQLKADRLTWDWSHIRDSSDEALEEIYRELIKILGID